MSQIFLLFLIFPVYTLSALHAFGAAVLLTDFMYSEKKIEVKTENGVWTSLNLRLFPDASLLYVRMNPYTRTAYKFSLIVAQKRAEP